MDTQHRDAPSTDSPAPGTAMTLIPTGSEAMHAGVIRSWTASAGGLVVSTQVQLPTDVVAALDGQRVWASTRLEPSGSLAVFQAVAQAHRDDQLALTGVVLVASEARRGAVRARTHRPAQLLAGTGTGSARTVDLSGTGVRLHSDAELPAPRETVEVSLDLDEGVEVRARGEVVRVDPDAGEAVVHFQDLAPSARAAVERTVLTELTRGD